VQSNVYSSFDSADAELVVAAAAALALYLLSHLSQSSNSTDAISSLRDFKTSFPASPSASISAFFWFDSAVRQSSLNVLVGSEIK
jgi:hypothetical protein